MQSQGVFYPFLFQIGAQALGSYLSPPPFVKDDLTKLTTTTSFFYLIDIFAR